MPQFYYFLFSKKPPAAASVCTFVIVVVFFVFLFFPLWFSGFTTWDTWDPWDTHIPLSKIVCSSARCSTFNSASFHQVWKYSRGWCKYLGPGHTRGRSAFGLLDAAWLTLCCCCSGSGSDPADGISLWLFLSLFGSLLYFLLSLLPHFFFSVILSLNK